MAENLTIGDWVLYDGNSNRDDTEPIWLERIMYNAEWGSHGRKVNNTGGMIRIDGVKIGWSEVAINVM